MNVLRHNLLRQAVRVSSPRIVTPVRTFSRTHIRHEAPSEPHFSEPKPIPESPSFYTTRAVYYDQLSQLEKTISSADYFLRKNHLLPLPDFARASLPELHPMWKDPSEMASEFKTKMTMTRYRRVTHCLNQINDFQRIAQVGGCPELAQKLQDILSMYESSKKEAYLNKGKRRIATLDEYGRSYTLGKRKTSSARVWMIPVKTTTTDPSPESLLGVEGKQRFPVTPSTILVNNLSLHEFFRFPQDREKITRPLKVAGVLGKYNVFAIVRGGGTTGQSGALAHGIAKGIVAHEPALETMFRRAKLTRRDPRMVERKKTGLAKARKRYTWVKR
ncbi:SSU ribosomal protein S9P [Crepidotus variabilis]|uniref:SSU ribosomal protein S9P n=1 Tax=Crepidotus variabilis TaxID=179855 RepID=A0A9P6EGK8_9AGAR|nr:SSU ribosomal protein S9P [Crepidotus variabilis]